MNGPAKPAGNTNGNCQLINGVAYCDTPGRQVKIGSPEGVGDNDEHPQVTVIVPPKQLRRTEVTVRQFEDRLIKNGAKVHLEIVLSGCKDLESENHKLKGRDKENAAALLKRAQSFAQTASCTAPKNKDVIRQVDGMPTEEWCVKQNSRGGDHPVMCITQKPAEEFCSSEGATLPSEVDIENASRGTSGTDEHGTPINKAIIYDNGYTEGTEAVCGPNNERENDLGDCDLAGNGWERTKTKYDPKAYATMSTNDPNTPLTGAADETVVLRGGSFGGGRGSARAANRNNGDPHIPGSSVAFRCVRERSRPQGSK